MTVIDALEDLMVAEQKMIRDGRLQDLGRIAPLKAELLGRLSDAGQYTPDDLGRLRDIAQVNAGLLEAAGNGLKSALRQIEDVKQAAIPATYTSDGGRTALGCQSSKLHQKV